MLAWRRSSASICRQGQDLFDQALLILFLQISEKFFKATLLPIQRRLLLRSWLGLEVRLEAEISRPRAFRDQRRACKRHE